MSTRHRLLAKVNRLEQVTEDIFRLSLVAPEINASAGPGQFVMLRPAAGHDPLLRRPFSVHQAGDDGLLLLLVKVIGKGTRQISHLQPGEEVDILGPLGHGFTLPKSSGLVCLVGGGIGAAPLLFLASRIQAALAEVDIRVLLGARTASEATALAKDFEDLGLQVNIATDDGSFGHHGLVGDLLVELTNELTPAQVFTCGPHPMLAAIAAICREKKLPCQVSTETMMACGLGACLGCAVRPANKLSDTDDAEGYVHVCKQGPVFDAGALQW